MSGITPYNIVTEFRFDIAHAVADSQTLQNQVGLISDSANNALYSLRRVGIGLVAQMGLFSGGVLGFLHSAIESSEKFGKTQRSLANVFLSNKDALGAQGMTFLEAMTQSEKIMDKIKNKAFDFALDPSELLAQTKNIAPMLLSHGLDTIGLDKSIDISRGLLKSAPTLGINPSQVQSELISLVGGRADLQNTLFQRLMSETKPFKDNNITSSKAFNILPAQKRIEVLRQSLLQFGSNAEVIAGNVNSLTGNMTRFMSLIKGEFSILRPIGDALLGPIKMAFRYINNWLNTQGRDIAGVVSRMVTDFLEDPIKAFVRLRQLGRLKDDVSLAAKISSLIGIYQFVRHILEFFGIEMMGFGAAMSKAFGLIRGAIAWIFEVLPVGAILSFLFRMLATALATVAEILLPLIFFLQIFSATIAKVQVIWASWMMDNAGRMAKVFERIATAFGRVLLPFTMAIDSISDVLAGILGWFVTKEILLQGLELFASFLEWLAEKIVLATASIAGFGAAIGGLIYDLTHANLKGIGGRAQDSFNEGVNALLEKVYKTKDKDGQLPVTSQQTNIGTLNINQQFKEQLEPDRIAFSAVEAFKKIAMNPSQAAGRSLAGGLVSN